MINVRTEVDALAKKLAFSQVQTRKLTAVVLTKAAYNVQAGLQREMERVFDRPTPFVLRSVFVRQAKIQGDTVTPAIIGIRGSTGGKVSPAHSLYAQVAGGQRRRKMSESLLGRILPGGGRGGQAQWVPGAGAQLDQHGNVPGSAIKRYISAMQVAMDQGVTSNSRIRGVTGLTRSQSSKLLGMDKGRTAAIARLQAQREAKGTKTQVGTFFLGPAKGGRQGQPSVLYSFRWTQKAGKRRPNNPNPGPVWVKTDVKPVLVFTRPQSYRSRLPIGDIAQRIASQDVVKIANVEALRLFAKWNGAK